MNQPHEFNVRQEADYVLGMMDLYQSDGEIAGILRTKGLTSGQIDEVLVIVRQDGYAKRLRQAKKIMLTGLSITALAAAILIFLIVQKNAASDPEQLAMLNARGFIKYALYLLVYGIAQSVYGIVRYFNYSKKIRQIS